MKEETAAPAKLRSPGRITGTEGTALKDDSSGVRLDNVSQAAAWVLNQPALTGVPGLDRAGSNSRKAAPSGSRHPRGAIGARQFEYLRVGQQTGGSILQQDALTSWQ